MGDSLDTSLPSAVLAMALRQRRPKHALLHHSDRGVQYASRAYRAQLSAHRLHASMSRKGNCYDNATMEAFWSTLKNELVHRTRFVSRDQARLALFGLYRGLLQPRRDPLLPRLQEPSSIGSCP